MTVSDNLEVLSERELEVLKLVATGATNQQIARDLVISPNTVKVHLRNIFEKLGVQSRTEATMEAVRRGWVHVPGERDEASISAATPSEAVGELPRTEAEAPGVAEATPASPATEMVATALPEPSKPELPPISLPELMPQAPARRPVARWQHAVLILAVLLAALGALAPEWLNGGSSAASLTAFTDLGRPQVAPPARVAVQRWSAVAPLPEPRSRLALASDGQRVYAIGGETAGGVTGEVTIYSPQTNGWLPGAPKLTPVANVVAGVIDGRIYVAGGSTSAGGVTDVLEIYDPAADSWTTGPVLPRPLAAYALAVWQRKLYVFGGWDGAAYRDETLVFDPAAQAWSEEAPLPGPRAFAGAAMLRDVIYVVGGTNGRSELTELLAFNPAGDVESGSRWTVKAPLQEARAGLAVVAEGNQVFALGGSRSDSAETFNEQYDVRLDAWSRLGTPVAGAWRNLAATPLHSRLYVAGGWSGTYLDVHEQYLALFRLMLPLTNTGG
jgi:DNA-binding CsgD family transcriptional regulator